MNQNSYDILFSVFCFYVGNQMYHKFCHFDKVIKCSKYTCIILIWVFVYIHKENTEIQVYSLFTYYFKTVSSRWHHSGVIILIDFRLLTYFFSVNIFNFFWKYIMLNSVIEKITFWSHYIFQNIPINVLHYYISKYFYLFYAWI